MKPVILVYIAFGVAAMFFGTISNDLLSLGIRSEIVSIVSKGLTAAVTAIGTVALVNGTPLPPLPKDGPTTHAP